MQTTDSRGWRPAAGDTIAGRVSDISETNLGHGPYFVVTLTRPDGTKVSVVHAFHHVLRAELARRNVQVGDQIEVTYSGRSEATPGKSGYAKYRVTGGQTPRVAWGGEAGGDAAAAGADIPIEPVEPSRSAGRRQRPIASSKPMITVEDILATFPGTREIADPFKRVENVTEWGAGTFRGGPLDGQRRDVPKFGPAFVRWHGEDAVHWYAWKKGNQRTYTYVGPAPSEGRRTDPQLALEAVAPGDVEEIPQIHRQAALRLRLHLALIAGNEPATLAARDPSQSGASAAWAQPSSRSQRARSRRERNPQPNPSSPMCSSARRRGYERKRNRRRR